MKLNLVLLLDDTTATNYIHKRFVMATERVQKCVAYQSGEDVLEYLNLKNTIIPELLYLDVNMPQMSAWEFLEELKKTKNERLAGMVIILLSTTLSPSDYELAEKNKLIREVQLKPLSVAGIHKTISYYFNKDHKNE